MYVWLELSSRKVTIFLNCEKRKVEVLDIHDKMMQLDLLNFIKFRKTL